MNVDALNSVMVLIDDPFYLTVGLTTQENNANLQARCASRSYRESILTGARLDCESMAPMV